jgi:phosphoribosyl 1,2-cyclic phosphodiesterase
MPVFIASLNSGSNGNCYYIGNDREAVLVDAGISCRETERRMERLNLSISMVKALFISHEHSDHINGASVLARKYDLPVYITSNTHRRAGIHIPVHLQRTFADGEKVQVGSLSVIPFKKLHDAIDPYSFVVEYNNIRIGVFTDIGRACEQLIHYFSQCHACFLESNYDEAMLESGRYPLHLKQRIRGGHGHLSNAEAAALFLKHRPPFMTHVLLSHLSKNNNHPDLALEFFRRFSTNVHIDVASRYNETPVYTISRTAEPPAFRLSERTVRVQLSLF